MVQTKSFNRLSPRNQECVAPQPFSDPIPTESFLDSNQGFGCLTVSCRSQMFSSAVSKTLSHLGRKRSTPQLSQFVQTPFLPTHPVSSPLLASGIPAPETPEQNLKALTGAPRLPELHFSSDPLMEQVPTPPGSIGRASLVDIKSKSNVPPIPSEWLWGNRPNASSRNTLREEALNLGNNLLRARDSSQSVSGRVPAFVTVDGEMIQNGQTGNDVDTQRNLHWDIPKIKIYGVNGQLETKARMSLHCGHPLRVTLLDFPDGVWKNLASVVCCG